MMLPLLIDILRGCSEFEYKMIKIIKENNRHNIKSKRTKGAWKFIINY